MGIMEMGIYFLLEIQASFFLGIQIFEKSLDFQKKFLRNSDFGVSQKNVQIGSLYTDFKGVFFN